MNFIYYSLSPFLRNMAISSIAVIKFFKKYGDIYEKTFNFLINSTTKDQIKKANEELRTFLKKIKVQCNNYYIPDDLDIYKIPIIDKDYVLNNFSNLLSGKPYFIGHTSGTTGRPLKVPYSKEAYQREYAFWWYHRSFGGVKKGDRIATFAGHKICNVNNNKPPFWVHNYIENQVIFSSYHISKNNAKFYIDKLNDFKPHLLHGYPSSLYLISRYILENDLKLSFSPKMIIASSETLLDFQRRAIEQAFRCKCYIWYGNTELCGHITECQYGKLHIQPYHSFVRIVGNDGFDVKPGEEGCIVGTNFSNYVFPLINYNVKDVVRLSKNQECKCGRGLIVDYIIGRIEDYIVLPDGRLIGRLDHLFKNASYVRNAQIEQVNLNKIIIRIEREKNYNKKVEDIILKEARRRLGNLIDIDFDYVNEIAKDKNGKFKFIIQNLDLKTRGSCRMN